MINYDDIMIQQYSSVINLTIQIPEYDDYYDYKPWITMIIMIHGSVINQSINEFTNQSINSSVKVIYKP